jgi:CRISPR/Cas system-associated protein endoribonuclease Cas2
MVKDLPPVGSVRALQIIDKQYAHMKMLMEESAKNEKLVS